MAVDFSAVVPVSDGCVRAGETLEALTESLRNVRGEVILADGSSDGSGVAALARGTARRVEVAGANAAELRAAGIAASSGRCVALVEPWTRPGLPWTEALLEKHRAANWSAAVGGPVLYDGARRAAALAEFLFEYGAFLPPLPEEVHELPVNNVSYPREILERYRSSWSSGFWKHFLHRELRHDGVRFLSEPRSAVRHARIVPLPRFCGERFHHGRAYAARRGGGAARAVLAPALPFLLTARLAREVAGKPGGPPLLGRAAAPLFLAEAAWSLGEAVGYLAGDGGSSRRVF